MSASAFDTLKFAKRLKEAGFTEQQAEALAHAGAELVEQNLATKRDIADLKRDIKELEVKMEQKIEQIRSDLAREPERPRIPHDDKAGDHDGGCGRRDGGADQGLVIGCAGVIVGVGVAYSPRISPRAR